jgi:elongation factor G
MDFMVQEQERGITITSAVTSVEWKGTLINLIDTPGHVDFTVEVERSLRVLDGAIALFCAVGGVEPQTETVWRQADKYRVPRLVFINKMDRPGADFYGAVKDIFDKFNVLAAPLVIPIGEGTDFQGIIDLINEQAVYYEDTDNGSTFREMAIPEEYRSVATVKRKELIESLCEVDEELFDIYYDDKIKLTSDMLKKTVRRATLNLDFCPILCGSAFKNKGIQRLIDAVVDYLPHPLDLAPLEVLDLEGGVKTVKHTSVSPLVAMAYKVVADKHVGKLIFLRVYGGVLEAGSYVYNPRIRKKLRVSRLFRMHADHREPVEVLGAGDIGAAVGLSDVVTGDTICTETEPVLLETIDFPEPVIHVRINPSKKGHQEKLSKALYKLSEEDPTFTVSRDEETEETIIAGMGDLHLEIIIDRLQREFNVQVDVGEPQVSYREAITRTAEIKERLSKQTGGHGQFAEVHLIVEPLEPGSGYEFSNEIVGGAIPKEYISGVQKGIESVIRKGPLVKCPVVDIKVRLIDGKHHEVDSSDMAFMTCAAAAFRKALLSGAPALLEPVMKLVVNTPSEYMGEVQGSISRMRGRIENLSLKNAYQEITALVPLSSLFGYAANLRNATSGRADFTKSFDHYAKMPDSIAEEVVNELKR